MPEPGDRALKPGHRALTFSAVRLVAEGYSQPRGSTGFVTAHHDRIDAYTIAWFPPLVGSSTPVYEDDLESLGELLVPLASSVVSVSEIFEWLCRRAEQVGGDYAPSVKDAAAYLLHEYGDSVKP